MNRNTFRNCPEADVVILLSLRFNFRNVYKCKDARAKMTK